MGDIPQNSDNSETDVLIWGGDKVSDAFEDSIQGYEIDKRGERKQNSESLHRTDNKYITKANNHDQTKLTPLYSQMPPDSNSPHP